MNREIEWCNLKELKELLNNVIEENNQNYKPLYGDPLNNVYKDNKIYYNPILDAHIRDIIASFCWENKGDFPKNIGTFPNNFHPNFYKSKTLKRCSPYDAWYKETLFKKCVINRTIHNNCLKVFPLQERIPSRSEIVSGFNISKIAPFVSSFKIPFTEKLINTYVPETIKTIVDPFAGFGGRMCGALNCGKNYIGFDVSTHQINSNKKIICEKYSKKQDKVLLEVKDLFLTEPKTYENTYLLTCSPYESSNGKNVEDWNNENQICLSCDGWIDEVLKRYKCDGYIFVVNKTVKYKQYLQNINASHLTGNTSKFFSKGDALVIVIKKEDLIE